jgi:hypothetical protein
VLYFADSVWRKNKKNVACTARFNPALYFVDPRFGWIWGGSTVPSDGNSQWKKIVAQDPKNGTQHWRSRYPQYKETIEQSESEFYRCLCD